MEEKYILEYGYRRLIACKKLGWTKIPAYINQKETKEVNINDIEIVDNTRLNIKDDMESGQLMLDIKQKGLLQPIGVMTIDKFDKETFYIKNISENVHRKDITPMELALACDKLKLKGYNFKEIAALLNLPFERIKNLHRFSTHIPTKYKNKIAFQNIAGSQDTKGIPYHSANIILSKYRRLSKQQTEDLFEFVHKNDLSSNQIQLLVKFVSVSKISVKEAYEKLTKYASKSIDIFVNNKIFEETLKDNNIKGTNLLIKILKGEIPPIKGLIL